MIIEAHRHEGVFIAKGKDDAIVTRNLVPGESVYGEKRMTVEVRPEYEIHLRLLLSVLLLLMSCCSAVLLLDCVYGGLTASQAGEQKIEYRVWNPFRSKLCAALMGGIDNLCIYPGAKVLYLGAASGTSVSHVSDVVGPVRSATQHYTKKVLSSC